MSVNREVPIGRRQKTIEYRAGTKARCGCVGSVAEPALPSTMRDGIPRDGFFGGRK